MNATQYQMRRHPIATFVIVLVFGPYLLAAALLVLVLYVLCGLFSLALLKR